MSRPSLPSRLPSNHVKARATPYPQGGPQRFEIRDDQAPWSVHVEDYSPPFFNALAVGAQLSGIDEDDDLQKIRFNYNDGIVNRESFHGAYSLNNYGIPLNPVGRTGVSGRGNLNRYGPNHGTISIITRWKRNSQGKIELKHNQPILELLVWQQQQQQRSDYWSLPQDNEINVDQSLIALRRMLQNEIIHYSQLTSSQKETFSKMIENEALDNKINIFCGYFDDEQNTDNSWIELAVLNYHDDSGRGFGKIEFSNNSKIDDNNDAGAQIHNHLKWVNVDTILTMTATTTTTMLDQYRDFIQLVLNQQLQEFQDHINDDEIFSSNSSNEVDATIADWKMQPRQHKKLMEIPMQMISNRNVSVRFSIDETDTDIQTISNRDNDDNDNNNDNNNNYERQNSQFQELLEESSIRANSMSATLSNGIKRLISKKKAPRPESTWQEIIDRIRIHFHRLPHDFIDENQAEICDRCHTNKENHSKNIPTFGILKMTTSPREAAFFVVNHNDDSTIAADTIDAIIRQKNPTTYKSPGLIISLIGGAKSFDLSLGLQQQIKRGIVQAALSKNAWIVTGGTNVGVNKLAGDIVRESNSPKSLPVIGIACLDVIAERKGIFAEQSLSSLSFEYNCNRFDSLNDSHSHFVLVETGNDGVFHGELFFRAAFEQALSIRTKSPTVVIVIQGGLNTIQTCVNAIDGNIPVVSIEETGKAAELLSYAWRYFHSTAKDAHTYTLDELVRRMTNTFNLTVDAAHLHCANFVPALENINSIYIYGADTSRNTTLDDFILRASLRADNVDFSKRIRQSILLGDIQVAKSIIDKPETTKSMLNSAFFDALEERNFTLVKLLLDYGVSPVDLCAPESDLGKSRAIAKRTLSTHRHHRRCHILNRKYHGLIPDETIPLRKAIQRLYEVSLSIEGGHLESVANIKIQNNSKDSLLVAMEKVVGRMVGSGFELEYNGFDQLNSKQMIMIHDSTSNLKIDDQKLSEKQLRILELEAFHMLFVWAVVIADFELAKLFWQRCHDTMSNALVASRILRVLRDSRALVAAPFYELRQSMTTQANEFENLAIGVLGNCYSTDQTVVETLLFAPLTYFRRIGGVESPIEIAYAAQNRRFIGNPATQHVLSKRWYGDIQDSLRPYMFLIVLMVFPLFVLNLFEEPQVAVPVTPWFNDNHVETNIDSVRGWRKWRQKLHNTNLYRFFCMPSVRFIIDFLSFCGLLLLHSAVTLDKFDDKISSIEFILLIWFISLLLEEIRQVLCDPLHWYQDIWNWIDVITISLYGVSFIYRIIAPSQFGFKLYSKTAMSINSIFLFIRVARYYAASKTLGPKILMLIRMMTDLMAFFAFIIIAILGFGVAIFALANPDSPVDGVTVSRVFFRPYFSIFGNLDLDLYQAEGQCVGPWEFTSCGYTNSWLIPFFIGAYAMITNILLVNLLIAMFNQTYIEVQTQATIHWQFQNFELFREYEQRPLLPGPFLGINVITRWILNYILKEESRIDYIFSSDVKEELTIFENECTNRFLIRSLSESVVKNTNNNDFESNKKFTVLETTLQHIEEKLVSAEQQGSFFKSDQSKNLDEKLDKRNSIVTQAKTHHTGLICNNVWIPSIIYSEEFGVLRCNLREYEIPWSVNVDNYSPRSWTSHIVLASSDLTLHANDSQNVESKLTRARILQRQQTRVETDVAFNLDANGFPLNPLGRTGLRGRGFLNKWGPNETVDCVITRFKRTGNGNIMYRAGKPLLEFLVHKSNNHTWVFPSLSRERLEVNDSDREAILNVLCQNVVGFEPLSSTDRKYFDTLINDLLSKPPFWVATHQYNQDERNTDNAWIETTVYNYHDLAGDTFSKIGNDSNKRSVSWLVAHRYCKLKGANPHFLQHITNIHNAAW